MFVSDDHVLMAMPELYRHSKNHEYFGTKLFLIYMLDAVMQVRHRFVHGVSLVC